MHPLNFSHIVHATEVDMLKKHCPCSTLRLNTIYVQTNSHFLANYFFICQNFQNDLLDEKLCWSE